MQDVHKPAFPENEVSDYSPVFGSLPARLTTKLLQRLGFTARDGSTDSRTRRTCTESSGGHGCGKLIRGATGHAPAFSSG